MQVSYWLKDLEGTSIEVADGLDVSLEIISRDDPRNKLSKGNLYRLICTHYDPEKATKRSRALRAAMLDWQQEAAKFQSFGEWFPQWQEFREAHDVDVVSHLALKKRGH